MKSAQMGLESLVSCRPALKTVKKTLCWRSLELERRLGPNGQEGGGHG